MYLERSEVIRKHISSAYKVLDLMCEKESKRAEGVNEVRQYLMFVSLYDDFQKALYEIYDRKNMYFAL